jgi:hypothetical protein
LGEDRESGNKTNEAIYTLLAVDDTGRPVEKYHKSYRKLNWKFSVMKLL